jgi:ABC-type branched-subunit amino acid transport system substrate-binding protein
MRVLALCGLCLLAGLNPAAAAEKDARDAKDSKGEGKIVIASSLPLTGILGINGQAKQDAFNAYFARVNRAGGVNGKKLELTVMDDGYATDRMLANIKEMGGKPDTVALLGLIGVPTIAASIPLITELRIPAVGLTTGTAVIREPFNRYLFPVRASYADEARYITEQLATLGLKKIIVIQQDLPFGKAVADLFGTAMAKQGMERVALVMIDPAGKNAAEVAAKVKGIEAGAIFYAGLVAPAVPLVKALRQNSVGAPVYAFSPIDATILVKALGAEARGVGITQIVPIPRGAGSLVVKEYLEALKESGKDNPHFYGLEGFIEAKILVEGLKRAGREPTRESLTKALETLRDFDTGGVQVSYDTQFHRGSSFVELTVISSAGTLLK